MDFLNKIFETTNILKGWINGNINGKMKKY